MEDIVLLISRLKQINEKPISEYTLEERNIVLEGAMKYYSSLVEKHQQKLHGLEPEQVVYIAQFYQSMTNKDPRKISFGVTHKNLYDNVELVKAERRNKGTNDIWGSW